MLCISVCVCFANDPISNRNGNVRATFFALYGSNIMRNRKRIPCRIWPSKIDNDSNRAAEQLSSVSNDTNHLISV